LHDLKKAAKESAPNQTKGLNADAQVRILARFPTRGGHACRAEPVAWTGYRNTGVVLSVLQQQQPPTRLPEGPDSRRATRKEMSFRVVWGKSGDQMIRQVNNQKGWKL
jgi:hypothetical protein